MTANRIIFPGLMPCVNSNGDRVAGAKAYFYDNGTSTLKAVYTDATLTVQLPNPVVANGVGVWPAMWADNADVFIVILTDSAGVPLPGAAWSGVSPAIDAILASTILAETASSEAQVANAAAYQSQVTAQAAAAQAQVYAAGIVGDPLSGTSNTSLEIADGLTAWEMNEDGLLIHEGQTIVAAVEGAASNQMTGVVQSYDPLTKALVADIAFHVDPDGAGPYAAWRISLSASSPAAVPAARRVDAAGLATGGGDFTADRTITVPAAAAADVRTGTDTTKALTSAALTGAAAFVALVDAATVAWDTAAVGFNARVVLGGNRVIGAPTNLKDGLTYTLQIVQDATGGRVPSFDAIWDFGVGGAPTLSTAANKADKIVAQYNATRGKLEANFWKAA